jgi:hypothetical protein
MEPIVRYFILCDGVRADPDRPHCLQVDCLMNSIASLEDPPYPLLRESMCVLLILTACRGQGIGQVRVSYADAHPEQPVFGTQPRPLDFTGRSPLDTVAVSFVIRDCPFPRAGRYAEEFWYNDRLIGEQPLELR